METNKKAQEFPLVPSLPFYSGSNFAPAPRHGQLPCTTFASPLLTFYKWQVWTQLCPRANRCSSRLVGWHWVRKSRAGGQSGYFQLFFTPFSLHSICGSQMSSGTQRHSHCCPFPIWKGKPFLRSSARVTGAGNRPSVFHILYFRKQQLPQCTGVCRLLPPLRTFFQGLQKQILVLRTVAQCLHAISLVNYRIELRRSITS